jgi:small subunit ribosomal protein S8
MTDPIADMLTRIRNALAVGKKTVSIPHSNIKVAIAQALKRQGYIKDVTIEDNQTPQANIRIVLRYIDGAPAISNIDRASKPGRRLYYKAKDITPTLSGYGTTIISTSQGVMTSQEATQKKLGGEVICKLW